MSQYHPPCCSPIFMSAGQARADAEARHASMQRLRSKLHSLILPRLSL